MHGQPCPCMASSDSGFRSNQPNSRTMPIFTVTKTIYETYEIEAESQQDAEHKVYTDEGNLKPFAVDVKEAVAVEEDGQPLRGD